MEGKKIHMVYGAATAGAGVVIGLVLHFMDLSYETWSQWLMYAILGIGLILNAQAFSKANDGYISFGQAFSSCFKATAIYTLIMILWAFISIAIFPDIVERGMQIAAESMEKQGMSDEQMEAGLEMSRKYFKAFMVGGIVFMNMFWGAIFSLIAAAIVKKKGPRSIPQQ